MIVDNNKATNNIDISLFFNDTEARLLESIKMEDGASLLKHLGREIIAADPSKERERRAIEIMVTMVVMLPIEDTCNGKTSRYISECYTHICKRS